MCVSDQIFRNSFNPKYGLVHNIYRKHCNGRCRMHTHNDCATMGPCQSSRGYCRPTFLQYSVAGSYTAVNTPRQYRA